MSLFSEQQTAAAERYAGLGQQAGESLTDYYQRLASTRAGGILGTTGFGSMPTATAEAIAAPEVTPTLSTSISSSSDTASSDYPIVNINGDRYKVVQGDDGAYLQAENRWATGNYNIAGTSADGGMDYIGNTLGYEGNPWVQAGVDLSQISDNPLAPAWLQLIGKVAAPAMIGYDTEVINGVPTTTTRGSFDVGEFTDSTPTDISGGAIGSNVARNAAGDTISIGYGYGQVDPSIARQLGFTVDPTYNPTPDPVTTEYDDGSKSTVATDPATGIKSTTYFDADGNNIGNYTAGQGLTLTQKADNGGYIVPQAVTGSLNTIDATPQEKQNAGLMMLLGGLFGGQAEETSAQIAGVQDATNKQFADLQTQLTDNFNTVSTNYKDLLNSQDATQQQLTEAQTAWETGLAAQNNLLNEQGLSYQEKLDVATATLKDNIANASTKQEEDLAQLQYDLSIWQATADAERAQMGTDIASNTTNLADYTASTGNNFDVGLFTQDQDVLAAYNTDSTKTTSVSDVLSTPSYTPATTTAVPDYAPNVAGMLTSAADEQAAVEAALSQALATGSDAAAYTPSTTVSDDEFEAAIAEDTANRSSSSSSDSGSSGGGKIVCTAMNERYGFGSYRNAIWLKYSADHMTKEHEVGYHAMFLPLVDYGFKQGDGITHRIVRKALEHIARHRTTDIRAELKGRKRDTLGRAYRAVLEPLCYVVGKLKS